MSKKETEAAIRESRSDNLAKFDSVEALMADLLAEAEAAGVYPLPPEERALVDAPTIGREWPNGEN